MKRTLLTIIIIVLITAITVHAQNASVPPLINYQGMLTDADGNPLAGTKKLEFNLYDTATGGNKIWGPQIFNKVPLIKGQFNVILGTTDTTGRSIADAFASDNRYLGIRVDDGQELSPRQQILSTPYAIQAQNGVPPGTVVAYWGDIAPEGWLLCNGENIPDELKYKNLRDLMGEKTPDIRGRVIVGAGQGNGLTTRNTGETGGEEQHKLTVDEIPSHNHSGIAGAEGSKAGMNNEWAYHNAGYQAIGNTGGDQPHNNMQPFYVLNYIIKY